MSVKTSTIDLFCGIGGLSYGLKKAGLSIVAGLDLDDSCKYAFEENVQGEFLSMDIVELDGDEIKKQYWGENESVKILVGCAPCQPFSTHANKNNRKQSGKKWYLLNEFKRLIDETKPEIVSMENVPNLANKQIFKDFVQFLIDKKYFVFYSNVFCPDYGIPQKRRRLVLLASKYGDIQLVPKTHTPENYVTVRQAIGDLPPVSAGEICESDPLHRSRRLAKINLKRIKASKPNGTWHDWDDELLLACHRKNTGKTYTAVYGRMAWDEPASTITTQFFSYGTGRFGHPTQNRALTMREGALLQTFPASYKFCEDEKNMSTTQLGIHIGNAVPVDLGFVIGKSIQAHLGKYNDEK
ncbi:MAG: DNA (cytosine-5-)-methyltransferase [Chloroflexota bacterium]|nr:DNA (cytosine-5-)-methyltransferase [Chloroflexota bacterium]